MFQESVRSRLVRGLSGVHRGSIRGPSGVRKGPSGSVGVHQLVTNLESLFQQLSKLKPDVIYNKLGVRWGLSGVHWESIGSPSRVPHECFRSQSGVS